MVAKSNNSNKRENTRQNDTEKNYILHEQHTYEANTVHNETVNNQTNRYLFVYVNFFSHKCAYYYICTSCEVYFKQLYTSLRLLSFCRLQLYQRFYCAMSTIDTFCFCSFALFSCRFIFYFFFFVIFLSYLHFAIFRRKLIDRTDITISTAPMCIYTYCLTQSRHKGRSTEFVKKKYSYKIVGITTTNFNRIRHLTLFENGDETNENKRKIPFN